MIGALILMSVVAYTLLQYTQPASTGLMMLANLIVVVLIVVLGAGAQYGLVALNNALSN